MQRLKIFSCIAAIAICMTTVSSAYADNSEDGGNIIVFIPRNKNPFGRPHKPSKEEELTLFYSNGALRFYPDQDKHPEGTCGFLLYNMDNNQTYPYIYTLPQDLIEVSLPEIPATYVINISINGVEYSGTYFFNKY